MLLIKYLDTQRFYNRKFTTTQHFSGRNVIDFYDDRNLVNIAMFELGDALMDYKMVMKNGIK